MAGYIGTKAVLLSTTAATVTGDMTVGGAATISGAFTSLGIDDNAAATAMTLDASGNVGIGTATPVGKLDVAGNDPTLYIRDTKNTTFVGGEEMGRLGWYTDDGSGIGPRENAYIKSVNGITGGSTSSSNLEFGTAAQNGTSVTRMRIDSSGNVGIGTVAPVSLLHVHDAGTGSSDHAYAYFTTGDTGSTASDGLTIGYAASNSATIANREDTALTLATGNSHIGFNTNAVERMRIDSSGNVGINGSPTVYKFKVQASDSPNSYTEALLASSNTGTHYMVGFKRLDNSTVGSITHNSSTTAYNTTSDYRLKENITPIQGAADIVKAMQPVTYTFKSDGSWMDGFLAHELQELHPLAVIGEKDAMKDEEYEVTPAVLDGDGNVVTEAVMGTRSVPDYQGVDYSKLTPILTAALQEALNKIDALEARLTALEAV